MYTPTLTELTAFSNWLWTTNLLDALFAPPLDLICGLYISPIKPTVTSRGGIKLGGKDTEVTSDYSNNQYMQLDMGVIEIDAYYGTFMDYSTEIVVYLPYIGFKSLPINEFMNGSIHLLYNIDFLTGDIVAIISSIMSNSEEELENVRYTYAGNIYAEMPLTSARSTALQSNLISSMIDVGVGSAVNSPIGSVASLASSAIISSVGDTTTYERSGKIGSNVGSLSFQRPYLLFKLKKPSIPQGYIDDIGIRSNLYLKLGSCKGFTKIRKINLSSIPCTASERDELMDLLTSGVYL